MTSLSPPKFAFLLSITAVSVGWHFSVFRNQSLVHVDKAGREDEPSNKLLNGDLTELTLLVYFFESHFFFRGRYHHALKRHRLTIIPPILCVCANLDGLDFETRKRKKNETRFFSKKITHQTHFFHFTKKKERVEEEKKISDDQPVADKNSKLYVEWLVVSGTATRLGEERKKTAISTQCSMKIFVLFYVPFFSPPSKND